MAKDLQDRAEAIRPGLSKLGARVEGYFFGVRNDKHYLRFEVVLSLGYDSQATLGSSARVKVARQTFVACCSSSQQRNSPWWVGLA